MPLCLGEDFAVTKSKVTWADKGREGGQKRPKSCRRHLWMPPYFNKARDSFNSILHRRYIVRHSKISHLKNFPEPSRHLCGVLGPSPSPWGTPSSARPRTDLRAYFIEDILLGIVKLVIWKIFWTPPSIWVESWGRPHPHGEPQHQQCHRLIL